MTDDALTVIDQEPETGTALQTNATRQMMPDEWAMLKELAVTLEAAGQGTGILPRGITNRYQIAAILKKGRELGFAEMYSLEQVALVNGKPVIQSQGLTALIKSRHGPSAITKIESTETKAVYELRRAGAEPARFQFTLEDAKRAGLLAKKGPWEQYPRVMLKWRCIGEGAREYFADTIAGLYLPDELDVPVTVTAGGEVEIDRDQWRPTGDRSAKQDAAEVIDDPTPDGPRGALLDQMTETLKRLSMKQQKSGTTLVKKWREEKDYPAMPMDERPDDQIQSLIDWANLQIDPTPQTPEPDAELLAPEPAEPVELTF